MEQNNQQLQKPAGPADYLANERTFLAWIRTSVALMGFGFVIVKFAVYVRQISLALAGHPILPQNQQSATVGVVMIVLGGVMAACAFFRYRYIERQLTRAQFFPTKWLSVLVTISIVAACLLMVLYLWPNFRS